MRRTLLSKTSSEDIVQYYLLVYSSKQRQKLNSIFYTKVMLGTVFIRSYSSTSLKNSNTDKNLKFSILKP